MPNENPICPSIFRAYDIRGIVNENLTVEALFSIGKAVAGLALEQDETSLIVAYDGRLSSPLLAENLIAGIASGGCDVIDIGMVPSPLLYYATTKHATRSGIMITGSHNPANYNGLKIVIKGTTLAEQQIKNIYDRIKTDQFNLSKKKSTYESITIVDNYIADVCANITLQRPLKIVIDAGNGVTGPLALSLYRRLGCEVYPLFCEVDGNFPNHHPDPSSVENLQDLIQTVESQKADIGLAFDGDGDRLGVISNQGEIIYPDRLLMLYAKDSLEKNPQAKVIFDVKCTNHLEPWIRSLNGEAIMWKTGHSLIKAKLIETQASLAGEMSGHFFFNDRWNGFDDALYAGARLLEILAARQEDSQTIFAKIPNSISTPELKILVSEEEKFGLMQALIANANFDDAKQVITLDGLRVDFQDGWGLVRPSNTTPYLVLRFEALNHKILKRIQHTFRDLLLSVKPSLVLPF